MVSNRADEVARPSFRKIKLKAAANHDPGVGVAVVIIILRYIRHIMASSPIESCSIEEKSVRKKPVKNLKPMSLYEINRIINIDLFDPKNKNS